MQSVEINGIGSVIIKKSIRAKRVILKIDHENNPVVVIPKYIPYIVGVNFAKKNVSWISDHLKNNPETSIASQSSIGRKHQIVFKALNQPEIKSRIQNSTITITHPINYRIDDKSIQKEAAKAATRAIKKEAEELLPSMLYSLAKKYGYKYKSVSVKNMRSRWGSCSSEKIINLNIWLIQLPDELIEYVCCHELAHLSNPHHQSGFWAELQSMLPNYKTLRSELKKYSPSLTKNTLA